LVRPLSSRPPDNRSIQSRPSGLSITSTIEGSSRKEAMAGPRAVRSIRAPREKASEWSGATATIVPVKGEAQHAIGDGDD
jgi:hypothetical protein